MKIIDFLKRKLFKHKKVFRILSALYGTLKDFNSREHRVSYGERNKDKTIFVIRPRTDKVEGLMSLFMYVLQRVAYAQEKGYLCYVDMKNYETQYAVEGVNSWELFFQQPMSLTEEEVYQSKNVILCSTCNVYDDTGLNEKIFFHREELQFGQSFVEKYIRLSEKMEKMLQQELDKIQVENAIGIYMRGTDYTKLKPAGHYVQPSKEMVKEKVDQFIEKYKEKRLFLVTEDMENYQYMKNCYGDLVHVVSNEHFISGYKGDDFLSKTDCLGDDMIQRGYKYLVKILLLAKCKYLITSITMGSEAAYLLNQGKYEDVYVFDLGLYE